MRGNYPAGGSFARSRSPWVRAARSAALGVGVMVLLAASVRPAAAACDDVVSAKLTCFERVDPTKVTLYFGTGNTTTTACTPTLNFFDPTTVTPPASIDPGFTPRVLRVAIDTTLNPVVTWFLGSGTPLQVDTTALPDTLLCGTGNTALSACHLVTATSGASAATATCGANERMLSGGGGCDNTLPLQPVAWQVGQIQSSAPASLQSWQVTCRIGRATANAMCCPIP